MSGIDRRGEWVALLGLAVTLPGAVLLAVLGIWCQGSSTAVWATAFQMIGAAGIWILCYVQLHQQRLVAEERLEVAELERQRREKLGGAKTIFDEEDLDQMERLAMGRRLRSLERFLVPALALGIAAFHLVAGVSILPWAWQFPPIREAGSFVEVLNGKIILFFTGGLAFVSFMVSRYALGMSRLRESSSLRAGGNFLFGSSAFCLAISVALLCEMSGLTQVEDWLGSIIGGLLVLFAFETLVNFILDFYRPRVPGEFHRPFYDSRLLGMFSEPGGILRSLANAIDYQFGFKVSETWFYKLLGRYFLPLLGAQVLAIIALTCIVVVPPGHQAVIERNGRILSTTAKPGLHLTYPWPIDRATILPVERIQRMVLGHSAETRRKAAGADPWSLEDRPPILWTKKHYKKEYKLLVADRQASTDAKVPVNLLSVSMPVQWRVKHRTDADVIRYYIQSQDPAAVVESLAYRALTRYAASEDITAFMGAKGIRAAGKLHREIQAACDRAGYNGEGIGVEIIYVGIGGVHPPPDEKVAQAYQDVVSAIEKKEAKIKAAIGDAAKLKIESGGIHWSRLNKAIDDEDDAINDKLPEAERLARAAEVERLLRTVAGGEARAITARAEQRAYARLFAEKSAAESYALQLSAYLAAPKTYELRVYLRMMARALQNVRKYVIAIEKPETVIYELDLKPPAAVDILASELRASEKKSR